MEIINNRKNNKWPLTHKLKSNVTIIVPLPSRWIVGLGAGRKVKGIVWDGLNDVKALCEVQRIGLGWGLEQVGYWSRGVCFGWLHKTDHWMR